jgi:hypothetical protein
VEAALLLVQLSSQVHFSKRFVLLTGLLQYSKLTDTSNWERLVEEGFQYPDEKKLVREKLQELRDIGGTAADAPRPYYDSNAPPIKASAPAAASWAGGSNMQWSMGGAKSGAWSANKNAAATTAATTANEAFDPSLKQPAAYGASQGSQTSHLGAN